MIGQEESGLTQEQYDELIALGDNISTRVSLRRYGPSWTSHDTPGRLGYAFDAAIAGDYLVRCQAQSSTLIVEKLADESAGDQTWEAVSLGTTGLVSSIVSPSIVGDENGVVRIFFYTRTTNELCYIECTDIETESFGNAVVIATISDIVHMAATSLTRLHFIVRNPTTWNRRLHVYDYEDSSWTLTSSDVYYPFRVHGFDAEALTEHIDVLALAADLPPLLGSRAVGAEVTTEVNAVQGILFFQYRNGRWSTHEQFDVLDRVKTIDRRHVRLTQHGGMLFASYLRSGGSDDHPYSRVAVSRSSDGISWEFPEFLGGSNPSLVLARDDYLYALSPYSTSRSPRCSWAMQDATELDITPYVIMIDSQAAEIRSSTYTISNPHSVLDGSLVKSNDRIEVLTELGYFFDEPIRVQVAREDILSWGESYSLPGLNPRRHTTLMASDCLARLNRVVSDYAAEWPGQQAGRDIFEDETDTGYGGLRYTAPYEGSWVADNGVLELKSSNEEGIAVSTFVSDAFNGSAQVGFKLTTPDESEYAGITFRVVDKDNLLYVVYALDDDKIHLVRRVGGVDTTLASSAAMGWSEGTYYYLKVVTRYAMVKVYTATDGINWTELSWDTGTGLLQGHEYNTGDLFPWSGRFGVLARGYSSEDTWAPWVPPDPWEPPWIEPFPDDEEEVDPIEFLIASCTSQIGICFDFRSGSPSWKDISTGLPAGAYTVRGHAVAPTAEAWAVVSTSDYNTGGLFYCANILAAVPTWSLIMSNYTAYQMTTAKLPQYFAAVCVDNDGRAYVAMTDRGYPSERAGYWHGSPATIASTYTIRPYPGGSYPSSSAQRGAPGNGPSAFDGCINYPGIMGYDPVTNQAYLGVGGVYACRQGIINMTTGTYYASTNSGTVGGVSRTHYFGSRYSASYVNAVFQISPIGTIAWSHAATGQCIVTCPDDTVLYVMGAFQNTMYRSGVELFTAKDAFSIDCIGRGFDCGDTPNEIFWVRDTVSGHTEYRAMAYTLDGGASWASLMGDWNTNFDPWASTGQIKYWKV